MLFLAGAQPERSTISPFLHLSFHLLSALFPPSIHFLHQEAVPHFVHLAPPSARSRVHTSSSLFHFPSLCGERRTLTALWQRQSADAGLKSDRPCPAATLLGSRRSITPVACLEQRRERGRERERLKAEGRKKDGWVWKGGNVGSKKARRKKRITTRSAIQKNLPPLGAEKNK